MKINKGTILVWKYKIPHYVVDGGAKAEVTKDYNGEEFIYIKWLDETKHLSYGQMDGGYHLNYFIIDSNKSNQLKLKL